MLKKNKRIKFSYVIPVYNEENNIEPLIRELLNSLKPYLKKINYEIIFIDDGSTDNTIKKLEKVKKENKNLKIIRLGMNYGKSMALSAGFHCSNGDIIVTIDGDLQDNPADVFRLYEKLNKGFDMVVGSRIKRKDIFFKKIGSKVFNFFIKKITKLSIDDVNCGLKVFKKNVLNHITVYGQFHRYIPVLTKLNGFKVGEVKTVNRQRFSGVSKYKTFRYESIFDLLSILFLNKFSFNPLHFFGKISLFFLIPSTLIIIYLVFKHLLSTFGLIESFQLVTRPLFSLSLTVLLIGILIILTGIICDFILHQQLKDKLKDKIKNISKDIDK